MTFEVNGVDQRHWIEALYVQGGGKMKKILLIGLLIASMSFFGHLSASFSHAEDEVRIGVIYPLTGALAKTGVELRQLYLTLQEVINNKYPDWDMDIAATEGLPNLGRAKVKYFFGDHAVSPEKGIAEAERLITIKKCIALNGTYNSSVAAAISTTTERMKIPFVVTDASSPALTERGLKWLFRTWISDADYTRVLFDTVRDVFEPMAGRKLQKLALLHEDSMFGQDSAKMAMELAKERGYTVVEDLSFKTGTTSLSTEVMKLKSAQPDWIISTLFISDALLAVRTFEELNYQPPVHLSHNAGTAEMEFIRMVGDKAEGVCTRSGMSPDLVNLKPDAARFEALYKKLFDYPEDAEINPTYYHIFSGAYTLLYAINQAGTTDPEKLRKTLASITVPDKDILAPTVGGGFRFNEKGHNIGSVPLVAQLQSKNYWTIYPMEFATKKAIYPIPRWEELKGK
jgi:branched-chain amino acid transport system substrate-binding protein